MKYLISSNIKYYQDTYPVIIQSLLDSNITPEDIIMVVGGCENNKILDNPLSIQLIPVEYNSFDLTALIYISNEIDNLNINHVFLMHDTCLVGPDFKTKSLNYSTTDIIKTLRPGISHNIGLYSKEIINSHKQFLNQIKFYPKNDEDLQKVKEFFVINEDVIFKSYMDQCYVNFYVDGESDIITLEDLKKKFPKEPYLIYINKMQNSNINRTIGYGHKLDFYKLQANSEWGASWKIGI